jgi:hypothetical protein
MNLIRVFTDFNSRTEDDVCWLLKYNETNLVEQIDDLKLGIGAKIRLFQDENDFEVTAVLDRRYVSVLGQEVWVAIPDWSTFVSAQNR